MLFAVVVSAAHLAGALEGHGAVGVEHLELRPLPFLDRARVRKHQAASVDPLREVLRELTEFREGRGDDDGFGHGAESVANLGQDLQP